MSLISYNSVGEFLAGQTRSRVQSACQGTQIVLTADRTLMAGYDLLFDGMLAASQTTTIPPALLSWILMPPTNSTDNVCSVAPIGLRRVEAALLRSGMNRSDIAVTDTDHIQHLVGEHTKIVAISTGEPCGKGMNTSTMTSILGGTIYPQAMFQKLLKRITSIRRKKNLCFKIVVGGSGAWQLTSSNTKREITDEIDHVITGYCEDNVAEIFALLLRGGSLPKIIQGIAPQVFNIPPIIAPSTMGVVEISRGCGLGCSFCTLADINMMHLSKPSIISDIKTNVQAGVKNIAVLSEDFFRYGSSRAKVDAEAVIDLAESIRKIEGLGIVQIDHCNISSVGQLSDDELYRIYSALTTGVRHKKLWVNVGVESPDGDLMHSIGCSAKMAAIMPEKWGEYCAVQLARLCKAGFMPMVSLIVGLPGEAPEHVVSTINWVKSVARENITIFPVIYAPVHGELPPAATNFTKQHWDLISMCYDLNFSRIPGMYWDNQTGAGVPVWKKVLLQIMGRGQIGLWKSMLAVRRARAPL